MEKKIKPSVKFVDFPHFFFFCRNLTFDPFHIEWRVWLAANLKETFSNCCGIFFLNKMCKSTCLQAFNNNPITVQTGRNSRVCMLLNFFGKKKKKITTGDSNGCIKLFKQGIIHKKNQNKENLTYEFNRCNASFKITSVKLYLYMASIHLLYSLYYFISLLCAVWLWTRGQIVFHLLI